MAEQEIKKPVAVIQILVYEDNTIHINAGTVKKEALRDILKAAEEIVIRAALRSATEAQPKIVPVSVMPNLKIVEKAN